MLGRGEKWGGAVGGPVFCVLRSVFCVLNGLCVEEKL